MDQLKELWTLAVPIFTTGDAIHLGILAAAVLIAGLTMPSFGSIVNSTLFGLVLYALGTFVRAVVIDKADAQTLALDDLHAFLALDVKTLAVYAISFAVIITVLYVLRSILTGMREGGGSSSRASNPTGGMMAAAAAAPAAAHDDHGHDDHSHGSHDDHGHGDHGHDDHGHGGHDDHAKGHDDHGHGGHDDHAKGHDDHGHGHDAHGHAPAHAH